MYPGPSAPDLGVFVKRLEEELVSFGHDVSRAVIDHRQGGRLKYAGLSVDAISGARRFRPDVVYAHFLVPSGAIAALASAIAGARLVLTAHGQDVRNIGSVRGVMWTTKLAARRAQAVIAVSKFLRQELETKIPELAGRITVVDCGVDLKRFRGRDPEPLRAELGWNGEGPRFLCVGTLDERKNVARLARAYREFDRGSLVFVGDGPLRQAVESTPGVRVVGRVPQADVASWVSACDVLCQPSLIEPFGQALLEAMASERSVVATRIGGPPEFVIPGAGVLVDPGNVSSIATGLARAAELQSPNPLARKIAEQHDVRVQARRIADLLAAGV